MSKYANKKYKNGSRQNDAARWTWRWTMITIAQGNTLTTDADNELLALYRGAHRLSLSRGSENGMDWGWLAKQGYIDFLKCLDA